MISMIRGAAVAFALLLFAVPAAADPILDFAGPPNAPGADTSEFVGDWDSKTGTLNIDDASVTALVYEDGSYQSLISQLFGVPGNDDAALGASVEIVATFDGGLLDTSGTNTIRIYDGSTTYFEAVIMEASIIDAAGPSAFAISLHTSGGTTVDNTESDWFIENYVALTTSGVLAYNFSGVYVGDSGDGVEGVTSLLNLSGKLTPTPEPGTLALLGVVAVGFVAVRRRRQAAA